MAGSRSGSISSFSSSSKLDKFCGLLLVISALSTVFDVYSDIALSSKYYSGSHYWWACWTLSFVVLQTAGQAGRVIWQAKRELEGWCVTFCKLVIALLNLSPAITLLSSAHERCSGDSDAHETKSKALLYTLIEVILESYPQFSLQLYIAAHRNEFGILLIVSVLSSFWSIGSGMLKGACACFVKTELIFV